jgi:hypothetical protein
MWSTLGVNLCSERASLYYCHEQTPLLQNVADVYTVPYINTLRCPPHRPCSILRLDPEQACVRGREGVVAMAIQRFQPYLHNTYFAHRILIEGDILDG